MKMHRMLFECGGPGSLPGLGVAGSTLEAL
jgi:hypothetical protein